MSDARLDRSNGKAPKNSLQKPHPPLRANNRLLDLPPRSADQHSMDAAAAKAARKEAKRKKKEAKLLKRKLEGVAKARRREEQAARERAKAAEYAACPKCPKCSLPTVSRGGMVFCSKAWEPVHSKGYFYLGGAEEYGGTGCGWSETPVKGAGEATCKRCGSTVTCTSGGAGGWDGVWYKQKCDNPHCGYRHEGSGVMK